MKRLSWVAVVGLLALVLECSNGQETDDDGPLVKVKQGLVRGKKELSLKGKQFYSFMGIPYAKPPVGDLRFKDPVEAEPWNNILGSEPAPNCIQSPIFGTMNMTASGSEDCLYLNVFTPKPGSNENIPVMVFFHGGAFIVGGAADYTPYILMNEDIVLVVLQYRLSILGFLSTEDEVAPGNMGLKDQQLALKWVQSNILAFGGDPNRVTIFGISAGAAAVHMQMFTPESKGLFHRVIAQSGTALCPWSYSFNHRQFAQDVGNRFGCDLSTGSNHYLQCMRQVDASSLVEFSVSTMKWGIGPLFVIPRIDGSFFPDSFQVLLEEGRYHKVDFISGKTRDEGALYMSIAKFSPSMIEDLKTNFQEVGPLSLQKYGQPIEENLARRIYERYLGKDPEQISPEDNEKLMKLYSDYNFGLCYDIAANYHSKDEEMSVYLYELNHPGQLTISDFGSDNKDNLVSHGDDYFYLFPGGEFLKAKPFEREDDLKLREIFVSSWTNFAKTGVPTPPGSSFEWERTTPGHFRHLSLIPNPQMKNDSFSQTRKFFSGIKSDEGHKENPDFKKKTDKITKAEL